MAGVLAATAAVVGCGDETPERAIYSLAHDLEHGAYKGACGRLFPGTSLPSDARRALALDRDPAPSWRPDDVSCRHALDDGALSGYELVEPRVRSVSIRPIKRSNQVEAVATAQVALDGRRPVTLRLALVDQRWRVVPEAPSGDVAPTRRQRLPPSVEVASPAEVATTSRSPSPGPTSSGGTRSRHR